MTILTVTGTIGAGAPQLCEELSRLTGMDVVDRVILAEAARRLGTSPEVVANRTEHVPTLRERVAQSLRRTITRPEVTYDMAESGLELLAGEEYREVTLGLDPDLAAIRDATEGAIRDMAQSGNLIFSGRAAHMALADHPSAIHVCTTSKLERRVERVVERQQLSWLDAERYVNENDKARSHYYKRFYDVNPSDPGLFHLTLNTDFMTVHEAANLVLAAAKEISTRTVPVLDEQA